MHRRGADAVAPLGPAAHHHEGGRGGAHVTPRPRSSRWIARRLPPLVFRCALISGSGGSRAALERERTRACQRTCAAVLGELVRAVSRRGPGGPAWDRIARGSPGDRDSPGYNLCRIQVGRSGAFAGLIRPKSRRATAVIRRLGC
jgi:hypothetical protein